MRSDKLTPEQAELARAYIPFARKLTRGLKRKFPALADHIDDEVISTLVGAARSFQPEKNVKFTTYLGQRLKFVLADAGRMASRHNRMLLQATIKDDHVRHLDVDGHYLEPEEPEVAIDNRDLLETLMRSLPLKHRAACEAVYFKGLKQVAAANELRMSQSRLSTLIRESIEIMKDTAKLLDDRFEKKLAQLAA